MKSESFGGRPPNLIRDLTEDEIYELGKTISSEEDVLRSLGVKEKHIRGVTFNKRWRHFFDKGKAQMRLEQNKELLNSREPSVQRMVATHTLPQVEQIEDGYEIKVDAPEWFKKGIGGRKIGRPVETDKD